MPNMPSAVPVLPTVAGGENGHVNHSNLVYDEVEQIGRILVGPTMVNAKGDGTVKGDGSTDDAAALNTFENSITPGQVAVYPPGIYMLSSPYVLKSRRHEAPNKTDSANGVTFKAKTGFTGTALVKTNSWDMGVNDWWHWGTLENVTLDCEDIAAAGFAGFQMGEESVLRRVQVDNPTDSAFLLTGTHAPCTLELCSAWGAPNYGVKCYEHPTLGAAGDGGVVRLRDFSGDGTAGAHVYADGSHKLIIDGIKSEGWPIGVVIAGSGTGGSAAQVVFIGGYFNTGVGATDVVKIQGTAVPVVVLLGTGQSGFTNWINDTVVTKTMPVSALNSLIALGTWNGSKFFGGGEFVLDKENSIAARHPSSGAVSSLLQWSSDQLVSVYGRGSGGALKDSAGAKKTEWSTTGVGFQGTAPIAKPTVTGSRGGNAALASLLTALANYGLITDSSS